MQEPLPAPHEGMDPEEKGQLLLQHLRAEHPLSALDFSGAYLKGAELPRVTLQQIILRWANLPLANLQQANLTEAHLQGVNLLLANLQGARLKATSLIRANLQGASLQWADLSGADLSSATLVRADLQGAYLQQSNLRGANLTRANLEEVNLQGANLHEARSLEGARIDPTTFYLSGWTPEYLEALEARGLLTRGLPRAGDEPRDTAPEIPLSVPPGSAILERIATPLEQGVLQDQPRIEISAGNLDPIRYFTWSDVQVSHDPVVCTVLLRPSAGAAAMASDLSYCSFVRVGGRLVGRIASISLLSEPGSPPRSAIVRLDLRP